MEGPRVLRDWVAGGAGQEELTACALQCAVENEELVQHLGAAKDAQRQLTAEVSGSPSSHQGPPPCQVRGIPHPDGMGVVFSSTTIFLLNGRLFLLLS